MSCDCGFGGAQKWVGRMVGPPINADERGCLSEALAGLCLNGALAGRTGPDNSRALEAAVTTVTSVKLRLPNPLGHSLVVVFCAA